MDTCTPPAEWRHSCLEETKKQLVLFTKKAPIRSIIWQLFHSSDIGKNVYQLIEEQARSCPNRVCCGIYEIALHVIEVYHPSHIGIPLLRDSCNCRSTSLVRYCDRISCTPIYYIHCWLQGVASVFEDIRDFPRECAEDQM